MGPRSNLLSKKNGLRSLEIVTLSSGSSRLRTVTNSISIHELGLVLLYWAGKFTLIESIYTGGSQNRNTNFKMDGGIKYSCSIQSIKFCYSILPCLGLLDLRKSLPFYTQARFFVRKTRVFSYNESIFN